jgi:hypothetical protein
MTSDIGVAVVGPGWTGRVYSRICLRLPDHHAEHPPGSRPVIAADVADKAGV